MNQGKLVNRIRFTTSIKNELNTALNQLSNETRIPKSKLMDEAIEDLLKNIKKAKLLGAIKMGEAVLVNRKLVCSSLDNKLVEPFNELSKRTRINKSRLLDEAIEDLLKKYERKDG